ncbi:MAG TPA: hypothetical protein VNA57_01925 [Acidimicrobiales bacterium]|nr:hypothetical protein [Acidimicrobiales bacterium]
MTETVVVAALAGSDCERVSGGWLAQPANAASSVAYAVVGVWLLRRAVKSPPSRALFTAAGLGLVAVGLGSVAYHGPQPAWAGAAHDGSILALLAVFVVRNVWLLARHRPGFAAAYGAPCLAIVPGLGLAGDDRLLLVTLVIAGVVGVSVIQCLWLADWPERAMTRRMWSSAAALMGVAVVAYAAGRTSSSFCWPDSLWQPHALWHIASAVAIGLGVLALAAQAPPPRRSTSASYPIALGADTPRP